MPSASAPSHDGSAAHESVCELQIDQNRPSRIANRTPGGAAGSGRAAHLRVVLLAALRVLTRVQLRDVSAVASTFCTPLMPFATATDFCTCALLSTTPDRVTTPLVVVTLMSVEGMPFVAISCVF